MGLSWNEVSRRYVSDNPSFYMPDSWRTRPDNVKQGSSETETVETLLSLEGKPYWRIDAAVQDHYKNCLELYEEMLLSGVAPEQARLVLPVAHNTEWIWSGSVAAFARVYNLRIDPHAQKETRDVAALIGAQIPQEMQHTWAALTNKG